MYSKQLIKYSLVFIALFICHTHLFGQDRIFMKDFMKPFLKVKVVEVTINDVYYEVKLSSSRTKIETLNLDNVRAIVFENGVTLNYKGNQPKVGERFAQDAGNVSLEILRILLNLNIHSF